MGKENTTIEDKEAYKLPSIYQKSNFLIGAKYKSSLIENKIMALSLLKLQQGKYVENKGNFLVEMSASELRETMGENSGSFYSQLDPVAQAMTGRTMGWTDPETKEFDYISVVTRATYKNGTFTIRFNEELKQYLKDIKENFTLMSLPTMMDFKSTYSFRLYELLRARAFYPKGQERVDEYFVIEFSVSELRLELGVVNAELEEVKKVLRENRKAPNFDKAVEKSPEKTHKTWGSFKSRVIDVAVKEINESPKADMMVKCVTKRSGLGGKVHAVVFYVQLNASKHEKKVAFDDSPEQLSFADMDGLVETVQPKRPEMSEDEKMDFYLEVRNLVNFKAAELKAISEAAEYDLDRIKKAVAALDKYKTTHEVASEVAFLVAAIKQEYEPVEVKPNNSKKNGFHNYKESEELYDFTEIEKTLLKREY